ncbi:MAG TPA: phosphate ABC transporter permease [Anaerolineaceae bacterium]|jgi:lipopolysaccharide transport system permease protein|nr:phosphate ABC transporter permease [Anaerolineaceae bacterium]
MATKELGLQKQYNTVVIKPRKGWVPLNLIDLWNYRELAYFLTWRNIKVRYKQSVLGILWAVIKPFLTMVVFAVIFGNLLKVPSDGVPYPIFSYAATLPWELFAASLTAVGGSMVASGNMISKIYFPRIILPISSVLSNLVDFAIGFVILIGMMIFYKIPLTLNVLWTIPFILLAMITALGVGLWLAALMVRYRDISYITGFLTTLWFYASPVIISTTTIPDRWRLLYSLNPMAGVIMGFRYSLLGIAIPIPLYGMLLSAGIAVVILISGLYYFRRMEKDFADMI